MARYSGIYLHLEGTTAELDGMQQARETCWDTDSGLFRYMDSLSGVHYLASSGFWIDVGGGSGIYYPMTDTKKIYFGDPTGIYMSFEQWTAAPTANTLGFGSLYLCGSYLEHRTSNTYRVFSSSSGDVRIYDGNNLSFGDPSYADPKWLLQTSGNNFYIRSHSSNFADLTIKSDYQLYLETWSGDMTLLTFNGGNIILKSSGFASDIKMEATGDIYTSGWQSYSPSITGWSSTAGSSVKYKTIGKLVFLNVSITGTGDNSGSVLSLPFSTSDVVVAPVVFGQNIGGSTHVNYSGASVMLSGSTMYIQYNSSWSSAYGDGIGSGNLKWLCGQVWYQRT